MEEQKIKKPIYKKWWFWVIAALVVLYAIGRIGEDTTPPTANPPAQSQEPSVPASGESEVKEEPAKVDEEIAITKPGEGIETKNFRLAVESVNKPKGNDFNKPASGKEFVEVIVLIENISEKDYVVSSMLMFEAYQDGFATHESLNAQIASPDISTLDGNLAAGKKLRGKLAYELPIDWKELEINANLTMLTFSTDGEIKIILQNESFDKEVLEDSSTKDVDTNDTGEAPFYSEFDEVVPNFAYIAGIPQGTKKLYDDGITVSYLYADVTLEDGTITKYIKEIEEHGFKFEDKHSNNKISYFSNQKVVMGLSISDEGLLLMISSE